MNRFIERAWMGMIVHPDAIPVFPYVRLEENAERQLRARIIAGPYWDARILPDLDSNHSYHAVYRTNARLPSHHTRLLVSDTRQSRLVIDEEALVALHEALDPCGIEWDFQGVGNQEVKNRGLLGIAEVQLGSTALKLERDGVPVETPPIPDIEIVAGGLRAVVGHAIAHPAYG
jgi:hypothetical protein